MLDARHIPAAEAQRLAAHYRQTLLEDFVPWWERHSIDRQCGGFYSCLERDGRAYAGDKFAWSLARQTWIFARLSNCLGPEPRWVDIAQHGAEFLLAHAFTPEGRVLFRLTREGRAMADPRDVYSECFAAIALAELSRATGDRTYWIRAQACYEQVRGLLGQPTNTPLLGYPLRAEFHLYAHDMARLSVASVFNEVEPDARWENDLIISAESVIGRHWKPDLGALLENVAPDGSPMLDLPEGRLLNPGHALETAWMLMELGRQRDDRRLVDAAVTITLAALERSWDQEYGGVRYVANLDGTPTSVPSADHKLWWPHAEALYAALLGWTLTGRRELGDWYHRVHQYAFERFADRQQGEWYGYLNRDGSVIFTAKANGAKGCFHLPRVFVRCYQLLTEGQEAARC
jgi:N-acylglucosamine 2-epimerase